MFTQLLFLTTAAFGNTTTPDTPSRFFWADYDADGLPDALVVPPTGGASLLRNFGDGSFVDATQEAGLAGLDAVEHATWADVDGDGRPDLFLTRGRGGSRLFLNGRGGLFRDASRSAGLPLSERVLGTSWIDYDGDARIDVSLATERGERVYRNLGEGRFEPAAGASLVFAAALDEARASEEEGEGTGAPSLNPPPAAGTVDAAPFCATSIEDQATGACIEASSMPTLGMLYPLGNEFMIDSAGRVGIGTTSPGSKLDVTGNVRTSGRFISTQTSGAPMIVSSSTVVSGLNADLLDGFEAADFSQFGNLIDTSEIANNAVTGSKLAASAVTSVKIANGTISDIDVNANAAIAGTKIAPDFGAQTVRTTGRGRFGGAGSTSSVRGEGISGPTNGYLGVNGANNFDGIASLSWAGFEIGVAGVSTGPGTNDNYGVIGQSNGVGVRGAYSDDPVNNHGELGKDGLGVNGKGTTQGVFGSWASDAGNWGALGQASFGVRGDGSLAGGYFGPSGLDGVRGETDEDNGYGVWGRNTSSTSANGLNRGVYGQTSAPAGFGVYSSGAMAATGTKSFINPHPTNPTEEIRFVCLEGNESGTYFRGSSTLLGGLAVIEVPEEFRWVTSAAQGLTVQLTVVGAPAQVWIESKDLDAIVVRGTRDVEVDYFVQGVRRGFETIELVQPNTSFLPTADGQPFGTQYPEALRQILVENGLLNADFTPNLATLATLAANDPGFAARLEGARRAEQAALEVGAR